MKSFPIEDTAVIDQVVENFKLLASTPRQSKHEKAISDKLKSWAEDLGYEVTQNKANDLIFDVPATKGYEDLPLTALQTHMDMVCVAEDGKDFDPQKDEISLIIDREAGTMTADGTTLGADDGAGVAMVMSIVEGKMDHGPLRIIITTDEEVEMTGALAITEEDLDGVVNLINVDSEDSDTVTISSAAGSNIAVSTEPSCKASSKDTALKIEISGLLGGHSGVMIGEGRLNGIVALGKTLSDLSREVSFDLVSFNGGMAENAIPAKAEAVILVDKKDEDDVKDFVSEREADLIKEYKGIEEEISLDVSKCDGADEVLDEKQTEELLDYICESIDGVYSMSKDIEGLVESSSNLGIIEAGESGIEITHMARSSSAEKLKEIKDYQEKLAKSDGLLIEIRDDARPWPVNPDSKLVKRTQEIYKEQNGEDIKVEAIHAGLECGAFAELSEDLDMISIGPDVKGAHSPEETLYLDSIPRVWHLLEELLK